MKTDGGTSESSVDLPVVLGFDAFEVGDTVLNLPLTLLEGGENGLLRLDGHMRDESGKAVDDHVGLLDAEDVGDGGKLVGGDLALRSEGGVDGGAVRPDARQNGVHLEVRGGRVGAEEGVELRDEADGERRNGEERLLPLDAVIRCGPLLNDDGDEQLLERRG